MNKKQTASFAMFAMVFGVMLSPLITADNAFATYKPDPRVIIQGELTAPQGDAPFGGKTVGELYVAVYDKQNRSTVFSDITRISATVNDLPADGTAYEGWLVDVDSGKKTSIGFFDSNTQRNTSYLHTSVENNFEYDLVVITQEPRNDTDPAPDKPIAGAILGENFRQ